MAWQLRDAPQIDYAQKFFAEILRLTPESKVRRGILPASQAPAEISLQDMDVRFDKVTLTLASHDEGGITEIDFSFAASAWHLYVVRHPRRDDLKKFLDENGVGCALHYPLTLHLQKCYAQLGHKPGDFPVAEKSARECLSLPIYPELTDAQIQRVAAVIKSFFK